MRLTSLAGEAGRNLATGVTPFWLVVPILALLLGLVAGQRVVDDRADLLRADRNQMEGVNDVLVNGLISAERCQALAGMHRFSASGAFRRGDPVELPQLPAVAIEVLEVTPAAADALRLDGLDAGHVLITSLLHRELGGPSTLLLEGRHVKVHAAFEPDRDITARERVIILSVPAIGDFETCLIRRSGPLSTDAEVMLTVAAPDRSVPPEANQLDSRYGEPEDVGGLLRSRSSRTLAASAGACGALVAAFGTWLRRREITLLGSIGVPRPALGVIHSLEACVWALVAGLLAGPALVLLATNGTSTEQAGYLAQLAVIALGSGWVGAVSGAGLTAALINPASVLDYLREA